MTPEADPAGMSRSELVREAHELGMSHLEHLHIAELVEAVTESREEIGEDRLLRQAQRTA